MSQPPAAADDDGSRRVHKQPDQNFVLNMMSFVVQIMYFVFKMMSFVLQNDEFHFKMHSLPRILSDCV